MDYIYEEIELSLGGITIKRTDKDENVAYIPPDPANSDYQAYLASLEKEEN